MSFTDDHEEEKVQIAIDLLRKNPSWKMAKAVCTACTSYERVRRRIREIPCSLSRGGHNKKLNTPSLSALKDYLLMLHGMGRPCSIDATITAANSIL